MKPDYKIVSPEGDVTAAIRDRLISLSVTDEDGRRSDRLTLEIDDRGGVVTFPETDVALDVSVGFEGLPLTFLGRFAVDRVSGSGMPRQMTIEATAANMVGPIRAPKTRAWENVTLGEIVGTIAGEAGLEPVTGASVADVAFPYEGQTEESDLHFLSRLSRRVDATAKPAAGKLVVVRRDEGVNASGDPVEPVVLFASQLSGWTWELTEREVYKSVTAEWGDTDAATLNEVTVGTGEPVRRLRHPLPTQDEARDAATSELAMSGRAALTVKADTAGFHPGLFAGGRVALAGLRQGIDGLFLIRRVEHRLEGSLLTSVEGERSAGEAPEATAPPG